MPTTKQLFSSILVASSLMITASPSAYARGFLTDIGRGLGVINKQQAEQLDDWHRQFKHANPAYGQARKPDEFRPREHRPAAALPAAVQPLRSGSRLPVMI